MAPKKINRRAFLGSAATVSAGAVLTPPPARAAVPASVRTARPDKRLEPNYADDVNYALGQGTDHWGEQLLALPTGPTFDNVKPLLGPANVASRYVTESGWYYLPFTDRSYEPATWLTQRDTSGTNAVRRLATRAPDMHLDRATSATAMTAAGTTTAALGTKEGGKHDESESPDEMV
ncbi:MAG: hypothetical protein M3Y35_04380 [Actinomycetota bacterium]|nr:hypothetical protein [Actinomycetota bacterium]